MPDLSYLWNPGTDGVDRLRRGFGEIADGVVGGMADYRAGLDSRLQMLGKMGQTLQAQAQASKDPAERAMLQGQAAKTAEVAYGLAEKRYGKGFMPGADGQYAKPVMGSTLTEQIPVPKIQQTIGAFSPIKAAGLSPGWSEGVMSGAGRDYVPVKMGAGGLEPTSYQPLPASQEQQRTVSVPFDTGEKTYDSPGMAALFATFNKPDLEVKTIPYGSKGVEYANGIPTREISNERQEQVVKAKDGSIWQKNPETGEWEQVKGADPVAPKFFGGAATGYFQPTGDGGVKQVVAPAPRAVAPRAAAPRAVGGSGGGGRAGGQRLQRVVLGNGNLGTFNPATGDYSDSGVPAPERGKATSAADEESKRIAHQLKLSRLHDPQGFNDAPALKRIDDGMKAYERSLRASKPAAKGAGVLGQLTEAMKALPRVKAGKGGK